MILEYNFFPFLKKHTDAMNSKMPKNKKGERCQKFPLYKLQMHTYLPKTKRSCDASEKLFKPEGYEMEFRVYFSRDYIFCRGDRYVLAYICAKNLNLIIWHLLHMCYPNKNRFILIFSLLTYCANLCLQFANLCLQFRVIIFRQIFDSALPWAVCCAGLLFI